MAEQLLTSSIAAPGFMGVNTQDSSIGLDSGFATIAENCVIDKFGRIGARKGWLPTHEYNTDLAVNDVGALGELIDNAGNSYILAAGNNKLFKLTPGSPYTMTMLTYGGGGTAPTIGGNNWQMAPLNGKMYFYQSGHDPLVFDPAVSTTQYKRVSEVSGYNGTVQQANCVVSAYGRTWSANTATDKNTVQFSDLLSGHIFSSGTSGTLNVSQVWPAGADEIQALAVHNNFLIIFGRRQILVYTNATDPQALTLQDTIVGTGCCARDSVAVVGSDILYLSDNGVRSFARVVQDRSAPMKDISASIRDELVGALANETLSNIKAIYSDKNAFYLLTFPATGTTYCFDTRAPLESGALRPTTWTFVPKSFCSLRNKTLLMGVNSYVGYYAGNKDHTLTYRMRYYSSYFDLGSPNALKMLKKIGFTLIGGSASSVSIKWSFDYSNLFNSQALQLGTGTISEYGVAEYNISEYSVGVVFGNTKIQAGGSGNILQLGLECEIDNFEMSIQKIDVFCKAGRTR